MQGTSVINLPCFWFPQSDKILFRFTTVVGTLLVMEVAKCGSWNEGSEVWTQNLVLQQQQQQHVANRADIRMNVQ
jgi:hypothetical protein